MHKNVLLKGVDMETSKDVQKSHCVWGVQKNMLKSDYQIRLLIKMGMFYCVCVLLMSSQVTQLLYDFTVALHHAGIIL